VRTASVAVLLLALASSGMCAELEIGSRPPDKKLIVEEEASLLRLYLKGGLAMHGILIASIVALAYAIERGIALRQQVQVPDGMVEEAMGRLSRGGPAALGELIKGRDCALARLLDAAVAHFREGRKAMEEAVGGASYEALYDLRKNVRPLGIVSNITPLLGLLGTVLGMIRAFDKVSDAGLGRGEELAGGIAEALITTGAGLLVAIPAFLAYHFYRNRSDDLVRKAEAQVATFIQRVTSTPPQTAPPATAKPQAAASGQKA
jgi:biopolymer transport protein ExbB